MTFARYSRGLWAETPSRVAKPAKVQQEQTVTVAKSLLDPAKVGRHPVRISQALASLSPAKSAKKLSFSQSSRFSREQTSECHDADTSAQACRWRQGVDRLLVIEKPKAYPEHAWMSLIDDAERFLKSWAAQAARLRWRSWEVWGVHLYAPWNRIGALGLVPSLHGQRIVAMSSENAVIETSTGNRLRYYRRAQDSLAPAERALIWELADDAQA